MKWMVVSACLIASLGLAAHAAAQAAPEVGAEIRQGLAAIQRGDFAQAQAHLLAALKADPGLSEVRSNLGLAYYADHKYPQAIEAFERALRENSSLKTARNLLPLSLAAVGRCSEAEPGLQQGFASSPDHKLRRVMGLSLDRCLIQAGNDQAADRVTQALLAQFPEDPDVLYEAGRFYANLSSKVYLRLMRADPHSARTYQVMASVAASEGNWKEAVNVYREALRANPALQGAHLQIAILLLTKSPDPNAWREALNELNGELRVNPVSAQAEYEIGEVNRKHGQPGAAIAAFRKSLADDPNAVPARVGLAKTLRQLGKRQEALSALAPAESTAPDDPSVHFLLAQLYRELGRHAEAAHEEAVFEKLQKAADAQVSTPQ